MAFTSELLLSRMGKKNKLQLQKVKSIYHKDLWVETVQMRRLTSRCEPKFNIFESMKGEWEDSHAMYCRRGEINLHHGRRHSQAFLIDNKCFPDFPWNYKSPLTLPSRDSSPPKFSNKMLSKGRAQGKNDLVAKGISVLWHVYLTSTCQHLSS